MINLRPYQLDAVAAIEKQWGEWQKELLILPTGTGKTIVFSKVALDRTAQGNVLIMAHRDELIEQARDKYTMATGLPAGKIKADECSIMPVTVGSVQTLMRHTYNPYAFQTIIVDEAHHAISDSYQKVLQQFPKSKVLGVTATPDRGDKKSLRDYFDGIAYEYGLKKAIDEGYLCRIAAQTVPLQIDISDVKVSVGDFQVNSIAESLEPYLPQIADAIVKYAGDRKTVVFLPLIETAQEFRDLLRARGVDAREVNGTSSDRKETLKWFDEAGKGSVLCNAMLLTEGWDCPSVDCIVILRPTKIRSLYVQMVGRGTRTCPGKKNLLLLDFLWLCQKHDLCRPADMASDNKQDKAFIGKASEAAEIDLFGAESDAVEARRSALAKAIEENAGKQAQLIDPVNWAVDRNCVKEIADYEPIFRWEYKAPTEKQLSWMSRHKFNAAGMTRGSISALMNAFNTKEPIARWQRGKLYYEFGWSWDKTASLTYGEANEIIYGGRKQETFDWGDAI